MNFHSNKILQISPWNTNQEQNGNGSDGIQFYKNHSFILKNHPLETWKSKNIYPKNIPLNINPQLRYKSQHKLPSTIHKSQDFIHKRYSKNNINYSKPNSLLRTISATKGDNYQVAMKTFVLRKRQPLLPRNTINSNKGRNNVQIKNFVVSGWAQQGTSGKTPIVNKRRAVRESSHVIKQKFAQLRRSINIYCKESRTVRMM